MDEQKLIQSASGLVSELLGRHGIEGIIGLWLIYARWIEPRLKKKSEDWVDWKEVRNVKERQDMLETKLNGHLEQENLENIKFAKMEVKMEAIDAKIETENEHIFSQLKSIHEAVAELMKHYGDRR